MSATAPLSLEANPRRLALPASWGTFFGSGLSLSDLVAVGVFATTAKVSSLLIALLGGGMNPVTLALKNAVFTSLLVVLLTRVRQRGALALFGIASALVSLLFLGRGMFLAPALVVGGIAGELFLSVTGGPRRASSPYVGAAVFDLVSKLLSLGLSLLFMREQASLVVIAAILIGIGYTGSLAGLVLGRALVKELRHAGLLHE